MGKTFNRLTKQVQGRASTLVRTVPWSARLHALEVATLELMHYLCVQVANDEASPADQGLTEAYHAFKKQLENVVAGGGNGSK